MTDFREIYADFAKQTSGNQKKIAVDSCLDVFFGYSKGNNLRLSFVSSSTHPSLESTKILKVVQGRENEFTYWTSFDLLDSALIEAYFSFCENLIDSVSGIYDEATALNLLRRRFTTWKTLFRKLNTERISKEKLRGLFGELVVLKDIIIPKYGINTAVQAWGGPDMQSKDFSIEDTWYEVKTAGANAETVHISSLTQLSSDYPGHLTVVRAEAVSPEYTGNSYSVDGIIKEILLLISDESTENLFVKKLSDAGIGVSDTAHTDRFDIKKITLYHVSDGFPRITSGTVPYPEITAVNYEISLAAISRFAEE